MGVLWGLGGMLAVPATAVLASEDRRAFAILLGALAELARRKRSLAASLGLKAILAGTLANLLNAAVAGMVVAPGG